ncbi:MAG: DUF1667 domain-containing protein [Clostridia bacterium]|nr:DUF1667 domain-containing protein [Clostridia bacterium]
MEKITKTMTCIVCPIGCSLTAVRDENGNVTVTGNSCPRGAKYATSELTNPVRTLTSVVRTENGDMLSVKTSEPIPKELVREAAKALAGVVVKTPVHIGDVIVKDILGTGSDIVATKNIP